ncbi:hypothetical protein [Pararhizobium haloflavum]|uniref:hypothetical protein n=1 Tax=Pararhizobium haloflavum TaxID=2037914 RepID=UPI000C1A7A66|nr:hypothetical protein [Pararhizobium haloflavum]
MTVGELIARLSELPDDAPVLTIGRFGAGFTDITFLEMVSVVKIEGSGTFDFLEANHPWARHSIGARIAAVAIGVQPY